MQEERIRVNHQIRAREVRVIADDGAQLGIMSLQEAMKVAGENGLDLVEVSPTARPPVCRVMDFGKFKYNQKKKATVSKRRMAGQQLKEVKLRPKTEEHDYQFKLKHINRFLQEGAKVKVTVRFRGRELAHRDIGFEMLTRIIQDVTDMAVVASQAAMDGKMLFMVLAPSPKAMVIKKAKDEERDRERKRKELERQASGAPAQFEDAEEEVEDEDLPDDEDDDEDDDKDDLEEPTA